jgi:hypothetical protein
MTFMKRRLTILLFVGLLALSCAISGRTFAATGNRNSSNIQQNHMSAMEVALPHAQRSVTITLSNRTGYTLYRANWSLAHGVWSILPPDTVANHTRPYFQSESNGFATGTEGYIYYWIGNTGQWIWLYWDNPYIGSNSYNQYVSGGDFEIVRSGDGGGNHSGITFSVS